MLQRLSRPLLNAVRHLTEPKMPAEIRQGHERWEEKVKSSEEPDNFIRAEHLWNEYQHRHSLIWDLMFRLTAAVVLLGAIPYTQEDVMWWLGTWVLAPPILGVVLAIIGFVRVRNELDLLDNIRRLYRSLQNSLFYEFHRDALIPFRTYILAYIIFLTGLAAINVLIVDFCWMWEPLEWIPRPFSWIPESWFCPT